MAVDIKLGATFEAKVPQSLFVARVLPGAEFRNQYTTTADGQRFLINSALELVPPLRGMLRGSLGEALVRSVLSVALVIVIVRTMSRKRVYWRA